MSILAPKNYRITYMRDGKKKFKKLTGRPAVDDKLKKLKGNSAVTNIEIWQQVKK